MGQIAGRDVPASVSDGQVLVAGAAGGAFAGATVAAGDPAFAPGQFTVLTDTFRSFVQELVLTTTLEAIVEGTGILEIN